eukprot:6172253-Pleurochrysis_carterae.AAC.2
MASGTGRPSNPSFVASFPCLPFDVWRSCHYQSLHWLVVVMCFGIGLHPVVGGPSSSQSSVPFSLFAGGLLVLGAQKTERSSKPGYWLKLMSIFCAILVFVRLSKDQMDGASRFDVPPARMLLEFGMDIIRPYLFAISVPAFGMTAWLYVPVLLAYSASLYISSTYLIMNLHTLGQNEGAKAVLEDVSREECFICIVLSMVLFLATTVSVVYNERQTIHVYNSMEQRMHAQSQEAAATQRAIQSELRAKEAERLSNEQALQMRNKCAQRLMPSPRQVQLVFVADGSTQAQKVLKKSRSCQVVAFVACTLRLQSPTDWHASRRAHLLGIYFRR